MNDNNNVHSNISSENNNNNNNDDDRKSNESDDTLDTRRPQALTSFTDRVAHGLSTLDTGRLQKYLPLHSNNIIPSEPLADIDNVFNNSGSLFRRINNTNNAYFTSTDRGMYMSSDTNINQTFRSSSYGLINNSTSETYEGKSNESLLSSANPFTVSYNQQSKFSPIPSTNSSSSINNNANNSSANTNFSSKALAPPPREVTILPPLPQRSASLPATLNDAASTTINGSSNASTSSSSENSPNPYTIPSLNKKYFRKMQQQQPLNRSPVADLQAQPTGLLTNDGRLNSTLAITTRDGNGTVRHTVSALRGYDNGSGNGASRNTRMASQRITAPDQLDLPPHAGTYALCDSHIDIALHCTCFAMHAPV